MKAPSRESIERILGPQPPLPVLEKQKPRGIWSAISKEEARKIASFFCANPTYSIKELSAKFNRSPGAIHTVLKREGVR